MCVGYMKTTYILNNNTTTDLEDNHSFVQHYFRREMDSCHLLASLVIL